MNAAPLVRILHLEDDPRDAELIRTLLESEGIEARLDLVHTGGAFQAALREESYDLVLADYLIPGYGGCDALRFSQREMPAVPFIMVTGQIGEEAAVECIRAGATDCVLKSRLARLGPSIRRALAEAQEKALRARAEARLRERERELEQAQKMEAIGQLATGIAHDFNNVLTVITGYGQLLEQELPPEGPAAEGVEGILRAADRAAAITRQLLTFSRRQALRPRVVELNRLVQDVEKLLRRLVDREVTLRLDLATEPLPVRVDVDQWTQVLLNLVVNARHATPPGGEIVIETSRLMIDVPRPGAGGDTFRVSALLTVSDTGCGMDEETQSRAFDPFFTTRADGQGTGLGLAIVKRIVQVSGGRIELASRPGAGTRVRLFQPLALESVATDAEAAREESPGGTECLLLIEDEDSVRQLIDLALRRAGYQVIACRDRGEALEAFRARGPDALDLVVADLVMPGLSASAFLAGLAELGAAPPIVYMSGYADRAVVVRDEADAPLDLLEKPFGISTLLSAIRRRLDEAAATRRRAA